jgi:hypothetical protein
VEAWGPYSFVTAKESGTGFKFTVQTDSEIRQKVEFDYTGPDHQDLLMETMAYVLEEKPDFHIDVRIHHSSLGATTAFSWMATTVDITPSSSSIKAVSYAAAAAAAAAD